MQLIGESNCYESIAVPFGCKIIAQIPRDSTLCTNSSLGDRAIEGIYVGADDATDSILVYVFKINKTMRFSDWKAFPKMFPFCDPDVLMNKRDFTDKDALKMHSQDEKEQKDFVNFRR